MAKRSTFREYLEALIIAGIFLGFTNTFVVKTFFIPSASMEETLLIGDHLFVNRFVFGPASSSIEESLLPLRGVQRGDIVIFRSPERPRVDMVKRCVGLPGDVIEVLGKELHVNGEWVDDASYTWHRDSRVFPDRSSIPDQARLRDNFGPYTVPEGHYFCLGDNRDNSKDSRFSGPLPAHNVKGRAYNNYRNFHYGPEPGGTTGSKAPYKQLGSLFLRIFTNTR